MPDRTTKALLIVIAAALWGLLLRPVFTAVPTHADDSPALAPATPIMVVNGTGVYLYHRDGNVYLFDQGTLALKGRAIYNAHPNDTLNLPPTFTNPQQ